MKKLTLFLSAMLLACATNLRAETATYTVTSKSAVSTSGTAPSGSTATYSSTYTTKEQLTSGSSMTLTLKGYEGYVITGITLSMKSNAKAGAGTFSAKAGKTKLAEIASATNFNAWFDNNAYTTSYKDIHVTMSNGAYTIQKGEDVVIVIAATTNSLYCSSFTITYAKPAAVPTPIFYAYDNVDDVENNGFYTSDLMVEIECDDYDAVIRYTTDGTEPTAESDIYDAETVLSFTNEFVTLRAKAFKGEDASYEATANYYHNSSLEVPYTTTQAVALYNALGNVENVFVEGSVDGNPDYYPSSSSSNYNITDGTTSLYMYRGVAGADCGLADLANLVQGDKVVVKGKLTAYDRTPQLGAGNTIVKWTGNTNPVLTCAESVAFGTISSLVGTVPSKTLEVTAKNLTEDIIVTLSDGAAFTLDKSEFDVRNGGTIKISPVLTVGEKTATLTLTSGEKSVEVALSATIQQAYTISWVVDNKEYTAGNPTTDVIEGGKVSVLPTAPADNTLSCSNIFVGWSTNNIGSTAGQTQPADLFTSTGTAPVVTENTTYHAVFATAEGEAKEYFKETFDKTNGTGGNDGSWNGTIASSTLTTDNTGWTFTKEGGAKQCAKFGTSSDQGSATTPALAGLTGSAVLTFRAGAWKGDANSLSLSISVGKLSEESVTLTDASFSTYTINITDATAESKITFKAAQASKARFFLDDVVVKSAVTLKDFRTNCEGVSTAIDNAAAETPALKSIENGQLVIIRDGVKYNAMGVRLQ